ncbi:MAG: hypothetical protein P8P74_13715 [Crocinitomicaceae bacterium]|nr:hypothetical protein [Crocinitomicaceae bacterium]
MKRTLALLCALFLGSQLFAQSYSYSFEGNLTSDQLIELESECKRIPHLEACKVKYKPESNRGELIFRTDSREDRSEKSESFTPIDVKSLLLNNGLTPLDFAPLND